MAKLLLLDDDEGTLAWMGAALETLGHEVRAFSGGSQALAALATYSPELIIADILMPEMDGLTFAQLAQRRGSAPIMFVSIAKEQARAVLAGAVGWVQKPATASEVRAAVERVLGRGTRKNAILVVDDDPDIREVFHLVLEPRFTIFDAEHGARALEVLHEREVDLVIADVHMPVMNGVELIRAIRAEPSFDALPIIVQTSDRVALQAPVWRDLQVAQLIEKGSFLSWMNERICAHIDAVRETRPS